MTDLSAALRKQLAEMTTLALPPVLKHEHSDDGTRKWLLDVGANQAVETVYIPEPDRGTLCISSQAGCALDCAFCATGYQGFNRNLTSAEILGQVVLAARELAPAKITNVVFMGMGEPLANYRNVLPVVHLLIDDQAFGLSRRRVTISTAGVVPQMLKLANDCNVALAVSLHAPTDELRDKLVPINKVHPIAELLDACWKYAEGQASRSITFEYVHARRRQRLGRARAAARAVAAQQTGQDQSDSVQCLSGVRVSLLAAAGDRCVLADVAQRGADSDDSPAARR